MLKPWRHLLCEYQLSLGHSWISCSSNTLRGRCGIFGEIGDGIDGGIWELCDLGSDFCTSLDPEKYCFLWRRSKASHCVGPFFRCSICEYLVSVTCCSGLFSSGCCAELCGPQQPSRRKAELRLMAGQDSGRLGKESLPGAEGRNSWL